jgi:hypothetical protein
MYYPLFNALNLISWIFSAFLIISTVSIYTEGFKLNIIFALCTITVILVFISFTFSYVLAESLTGKMRENCKKIMAEKKIPYVDRATATVRLKMVFFLILFTVNLFLSNILTYYNRNNIDQIVNFFVITILVSILLANTIFKLIYDVEMNKQINSKIDYISFRKPIAGKEVYDVNLKLSSYSKIGKKNG